MSIFSSYKKWFIPLVCLGLLLSSCEKFTEIDPPKNTINTTQAFENEASAQAAMVGVYATLAKSSNAFGTGYVMLDAGMSADELKKFGADTDVLQFMNNTLVANNSHVSSLWSGAYLVIMQTNACLEGVASSNGLSEAVKKQFTGEAKLVRAFCHFYLLNLFGDVPLIVSTDWRTTSTQARSPRQQVYQQIHQDLLDAQLLLPASYASGARIRATQGAATALLARVALYQENWADAETAATQLIERMGTTPLPALTEAFLVGNPEAIWQLQATGYYKNVYESSLIIPNSGQPLYTLHESLLTAFEPGDERKMAWTSSTEYEGQTWYFPYKYKDNIYNSSSTEHNMVLRLAEQYLIRAEARAQQGKLADALSDLNVIRARAGLADLEVGLSQEECLRAVEQERRVELFAEWGHRWMDLRRTDRINAVLAPLKPGWQPNAALYPIPLSEIRLDAKLTQNPGYN